VIRYLKWLLLLGLPTTVLGVVIIGLFAHQGGVMLHVGMALAPGFVLASALPGKLPLLVVGIPAQIAYWLIILRAFFSWRARRATGA